ncbi:MAG: PHB depolymerase family esterase [Sinimarinibacterium sp.]
MRSVLIVVAGLAGIVLQSCGLPIEEKAASCTPFTPERVEAGAGCAPVYGAYCPLVTGDDAVRSRSEVIPCDGVSVETYSASGGGYETDYLAIRGPRAPQAIYVALHYLGAENDYFANLTRMTELAKARDVLVLVPQAPERAESLLVSVDGNLFPRWPTEPGSAGESHLQLIDGMLADARNRFGVDGVPVFAAGLSNGGPMAYFLACGRAAVFDAIEVVAGSQDATSAAQCAPARAVGVVIVHGTADPVTPYAGLVGLTRTIPEIYEGFKALGGCVGEDRLATLRGVSEVRFQYAQPCNGGRRMVLATVVGNGHNWPGDDTGTSNGIDLGVGVFGPTIDDFDSTLQGYDLLHYAAGI